MAGKILIIDDEKNMRHMLTALLEKEGYAVDTAASGGTGVKMAARALKLDAPYDFILLDVKMPGVDGISLLKDNRGTLTRSMVIMMSAYGTIDTAVSAMRHGAFDFISKPFKPDEVSLLLQRAAEHRDLKNENLYLKDQLGRMEGRFRFSSMVAKSDAMKSVFALARKAARYPTTVLIFGGSGTGKELIARGIHGESDRAQRPMVPVNCGGIPETLMESELFGHKKGAFTGAVCDKKGLFEEADGGTLFLDEIGELPLSMQVKLLRVLQEGEVRPVGDVRTRKIDVRVIAATSRNLREEVAKGAFREDLYFRLNVLSIALPPLAGRQEDIPLLCDHFLKTFNHKLGCQVSGVSPAAMKLLLAYPWPGNVRELENAMERSVVLTDRERIDPASLPSAITGSQPGHPVNGHFSPEGFSLKAAVRKLEGVMIRRALEETGGNRTQASKLLEISHPSLLSKMKLHHLR
ncbi:sigma-54-dependent transcriptional regulator [Desulfoluna spongiiphila]|uniref:Two component, sigma54 specific, transcriptional regulator, Fis family n=1 Tax=Desulfoluna spongiiphila TaxID=419481 RepID=A0A1G5AKN1_9BACT|nr:sigma-54 dependent transcriptional regulator [Desulfoluna spongiiphila]SCX78458.1 two component, sigma54 specific, transcriptional regulator, Fis family [Desulfoluna spongiiphila]